MAGLKKILLVIMAVVLLMVLPEIVFRLISAYKSSGWSVPDEIIWVVPDRELGWRLKIREEGPLATNELGLRDTAYNPRADITILLLGDSLSWGDGVADVKKVYPFLLEQILSKATGLAVEVINASVPGYSTFQQLRYLQLYGLDLEPDLIILQFCLNDVVERYSALTAYGGKKFFMGIDTRQFIQGLNGWLLRNSIVYETITRLLISLCRDREEYDVKKLASEKLSQRLQSAWNLTLSEIDGIRRISGDKNIPLMIVAAPYNFQLNHPQKANQPQQVLRQYGGDHDVPVVDLLLGFDVWAKKNPGIPLFIDGNHFSSWGHELTADILVAPVVSIINKAAL